MNSNIKRCRKCMHYMRRSVRHGVCTLGGGVIYILAGEKACESYEEPHDD